MCDFLVALACLLGIAFASFTANVGMAMFATTTLVYAVHDLFKTK